MCSVCKESPDMKKVWGCEGRAQISKPTMIDEENGVKRIFWSCPVRFIPDSVWSFISIYNFYQRHPHAPFYNHDSISPRFRLAEAVYQRALDEYIQEK